MEWVCLCTGHCWGRSAGPVGDQPHRRTLGLRARDHDQLTGAWLYRSDQEASQGQAGSGRANCPCVRVLWASELCWGETPLGQLSGGLQAGMRDVPWASAAQSGHRSVRPLPAVCLPCLTHVSGVTAQTRRKQNTISCSPLCLLAEQSQSILFTLNLP